jgi:thiol-disulfide isomerase/thioredoxin
MRSSGFGPPILLCAALAGCWTTAAAPPLNEVPEPLPAPGLDLPDLAGTPFTLVQLDGQVVLVNFWATWCPPCRKEMPALQRLSERLQGEPFAVLGVNVGEAPERIEDFLPSLPVSPGFPILLDRSGDTAKAWNVRVVPTTWVVDREMRKVLGAVGEVDFDSPDLMEQLGALLAADPLPPHPGCDRYRARHRSPAVMKDPRAAGRGALGISTRWHARPNWPAFC